MNKKTSLIIVGLITISLVVFFIVQRFNKSSYETTTVKKGDMIEEVSASGKVETLNKIDLHFKNSGKLTLLNAKVGEKVLTGTLLARQDTTQFDAQINEMQAGIDLQKARLEQLLAGPSTEDLSIAETAISNAEIAVANSKQSLENSKQSFINIVKDTYTKSDDAIRNKIDKFFSNPRSTNPDLNFIVTDTALASEVEFERYIIETKLQQWNSSLLLLNNNSEPQGFYVEALSNLNTIKSFLEKVAFAVNALTPTSSLTQTMIDSYKADTSTARTNISVSLSGLLSAEENFKTKEAGVKIAEGNLRTAQEQLNLKKSPIRTSDSDIFQAQIRQAEASLQKIIAQRNELIIFAPFSGVVVETNGEIGEVVSSNTTIISIASVDSLQIKLNIVEDNIANVRVGQEAKVTLDAVKDKSFVGRVASINPTETIVGGAVYYQAIIVCDKKSEEARSGMSANVWIKTNESKDTLLVPASAILKKDNKKIVQVLEGNNIQEKEVVTGIRDNTGMIEVISGLSESEQVIIGNTK